MFICIHEHQQPLSSLPPYFLLLLKVSSEQSPWVAFEVFVLDVAQVLLILSLDAFRFGATQILSYYDPKTFPMIGVE